MRLGPGEAPPMVGQGGSVSVSGGFRLDVPPCAQGLEALHPPGGYDIGLQSMRTSSVFPSLTPPPSIFETRAAGCSRVRH